MNSEYDHKKIEEKWQEYWRENNLYKTPENPEDSQYVLDMFPYPSGSGLHVGHVEGYTGTDVYSRFKRMQGKDVLHPMGWDAFGLPAENYAIKTDVHPRKKTDESITTFKEQINRLGLSYDWDREIDTSRADYYRWTQWLFTELFKNNLAEKKPAKVNWCPGCQTVLANEQVVDGACERCDSQVVQKEMDQWFFTITDYADELIDELDRLDWPESTKQAQRSWVGRQDGARFSFPVTGRKEPLEVFTTRPDTLFGVTFMVVAPEHEVINDCQSEIENWDAVSDYIAEAQAKTDRQRKEAKEKTGVKLEGITAEHPATGEEIPIFVADYVLGDYGTGAIMAVPAHDKRDYEFADKKGLQIVNVIKPLNPRVTQGDEPLPIPEDIEEYERILQGEKVYTLPGILHNSDEFDGMKSEIASGDIREKYGKLETTYRLRDWSVGRQRFWGAPIPVVYDPEGEPHPVPEEHLPWKLPGDVEFEPTGEPPLAKSAELKERTERIFGDGWTPEISTLDTFVDSSWYFLRFTDPDNAETFADSDTINDWCPVNTYVGGAEHSVMHLLYARFITKALADMGHVDFREPFSVLRHPGLIMAEDGTKMSKSKGNVVNPNTVVDQVGADTLRLYELFSGPFADTVEWDTDSIAGPRRFLERLWRLVNTDTPNSDNLRLVPEDDQRVHQTIKRVTEDINDFKFNTAISSLMELVNDFQDREAVSGNALGVLLRLLAPFAPHITEELWQKLGGEPSVHELSWPDYDETTAKAREVTVAIQVNGTVRGEMTISPDTDKDAVLTQAKEQESITNWLEGKAITREIYVPNQLVNFVTEE